MIQLDGELTPRRSSIWAWLGKALGRAKLMGQFLACAPRLIMWEGSKRKIK